MKIKIIFLLFLLAAAFGASAQSGAPEDDIIMNTLGYRILGQSAYVFRGYYSGNYLRKGLTVYFEYKKDDANFNSGAQKTIVIEDSGADESKDFYISPELNMFSVYHFRAVGYFNDNPNVKFYGGTISVNTGTGVSPSGSYPYTPSVENGGWSSWTLWTACSAVGEGATGTRSRSRTCTNPIPSAGGRGCYGSNGGEMFGKETVSKPCQNGKWGAWTPPASSCTPQCNQRCSDIYTRQCDSPPPSNGGRTCPGASTDLRFTEGAPCGIPLGGNGGGNPPVTTPPTGTPITTPTSASAPTGGLVTCAGDNVNCGFKELMEMLKNVIDYLFKYLVLPIAALMFAYAGFEMVFSGGVPEKRQKAISIFTNVGIGLVLAAGAFVIIRTVLSILGAQPGYTDWFGIF